MTTGHSGLRPGTQPRLSPPITLPKATTRPSPIRLARSCQHSTVVPAPRHGRVENRTRPTLGDLATPGRQDWQRSPGRAASQTREMVAGVQSVTRDLWPQLEDIL